MLFLFPYKSPCNCGSAENSLGKLKLKQVTGISDAYGFKLLCGWDMWNFPHRLAKIYATPLNLHWVASHRLNRLNKNVTDLLPCSATSLSPFLKADGFKFFAAHFLCVFCFSAASCVSLLSGAMSCRGAVPFCLPIWGSGPMSLLPPEASFFYTPSVATTAYFLFWFVYLLTYYGLMSCALIPNF